MKMKEFTPMEANSVLRADLHLEKKRKHPTGHRMLNKH